MTKCCLSLHTISSTSGSHLFHMPAFRPLSRSGLQTGEWTTDWRVDYGLGWTTDWGGLRTGVDYRLESGLQTGVDYRLESGLQTGVDYRLGWTTDWGGLQTGVDYRLESGLQTGVDYRLGWTTDWRVDYRLGWTTDWRVDYRLGWTTDWGGLQTGVDYRLESGLQTGVARQLFADVNNKTDQSDTPSRNGEWRASYSEHVVPPLLPSPRSDSGGGCGVRGGRGAGEVLGRRVVRFVR